MTWRKLLDFYEDCVPAAPKDQILASVGGGRCDLNGPSLHFEEPPKSEFEFARRQEVKRVQSLTHGQPDSLDLCACEFLSGSGVRITPTPCCHDDDKTDDCPDVGERDIRPSGVSNG
jgi:hypothetical protein